MSADKHPAEVLADRLDRVEVTNRSDAQAVADAADMLRRIPALEAERDRLRVTCAEWEAKAMTWLASPEAAQRLAGYRDLARQAADAMNERDQLRAEVNALRADAECFRFWVREAAQDPCNMARLIANCITEADYRAVILPCVAAAHAAINAARKDAP